MSIYNNAVSLSFMTLFTKTLGTAQKLASVITLFPWDLNGSLSHLHKVNPSLNPGLLNPQPCTLCIKLLQVSHFRPEKYPVGFSIESSLLYIIA